METSFETEAWQPRGPVSHSVGARVSLVGLRLNRHLNGCLGVVRELPGEDGRYVVELEDGTGCVGPRDSNLRRSPRPLSVGRYVLLHGLIGGRAQYNGQAARVMAVEAGERLRVELGLGTDCLSVPHLNTLPLAAVDSPTPPQRGSCAVCLQQSAMVAADPCGHCNLCLECSNSMTARAPCVSCRRPVERFLRLYQ